MFCTRTKLIKCFNFVRISQTSRNVTTFTKSEHLINKLQSILGTNNVSTAQTIREQHGRDESPYPSLPPDIVVIARSNDDVRKIHSLCYESNVPIIPYGAGTGVEGGVCAINGGVCIDLSNMNKILEVNERDFDCTVEAGVDWRSLNDYLRDTGLYFPVDPGASATLGGMAATCASGTNAVAFGTMKQNVLNLEVVLPDGNLINTSGKRCRARKSSAGYDLTSLFVGSEGTLGTITKVCLKLSAIPNAVASGVCSFPDDRSAIVSVIESLQSSIPLARVEYMDSLSIQICRNYSKVDLPEKPTLFLEFIGSTVEQLNQRVEAVRQIAISNGGSHFECSSDPSDRKRLWKARHEMHFSCNTFKPNQRILGTDVCVPISRLTDMILQTKQLFAEEGLEIPIFGHVGDGNFHTNLFFDENDTKDLARVKKIAERIGELGLSLGGTCTGEHGIGIGKVNLLQKQFSPEAIHLMKTLKLTIDPKSLMNPKKVLP